MDRSIFVGILVSYANADGKEVEHVLVDFLGEGNDSIVFGVAPRTNPAERKAVLKFLKPEPRFEMTVLHHSLKIADELYPDHPLRMAPEERLRRLAAEMRQRIESPGVIFRTPAFAGLVHGTVEVLVFNFLERFSAGTLAPDFLDELPGLAPSLDETLATHIESLLDDDVVHDHVRDFLGHCVDRIRATAARRAGMSLAANRLFKLLGLHLAGFIAWDELLALTAAPLLQPALERTEVKILAHATSALHYRAQGLKSRTDAGYGATRDATIAAARLLHAKALGFDPPLDLEAAYARNWEARTRLADGETEAAIALHQAALAIATTPASLRERHDALLDLAGLLSESDPPRAQAMAAEAQGIRRTLGVD